jgi:drug/metabolite transporter (DMT)-like permease
MKTKQLSSETVGVMYGFLGVLSFSLTLPATRLAVVDLDPIFVGLGRAVVAGLLSLVALWGTGQPLPNAAQWRGLAVVAVGVVLGFPLLSAIAMRNLPAAHGAVVIGLIPLATAIAAIFRTQERPSLAFWLAGVVGSLAIVGFAVISGAGQILVDDLFLVGAVIAAALGYAEGGKLSQSLGGWQVICWALVMIAPILAIPVIYSVMQHGLEASAIAWLGFGYVCVFSQFLGFFAWYHGMKLAGVARVSQLQLLQPVMTLGFSTLLMGEEITPLMMLTAGIVMGCVWLGKRALIAR